MQVSLSKPIAIDGRMVSSLTLRDEPLAGDLWDLTYRVAQTEHGIQVELRVSDVLSVAARMADMPPAMLKCLSAADAHTIFGLIAPFCLPGGGPETLPAPPANLSSAAPVVSPPER